MTAIKIRGFAGMNPRRSDQKLPDNMASHAANCLLLSGELRPLHHPSLLNEFYPPLRHNERLDLDARGPDESSYDEYMNSVVQPILWIKGYKGVVNDGSYGPIGVTRYRAGYPNDPAWEDVVEQQGPLWGATIDPSGGAIQIFQAADEDWSVEGYARPPSIMTTNTDDPDELGRYTSGWPQDVGISVVQFAASFWAREGSELVYDVGVVWQLVKTTGQTHNVSARENVTSGESIFASVSHPISSPGPTYDTGSFIVGTPTGNGLNPNAIITVRTGMPAISGIPATGNHAISQFRISGHGGAGWHFGNEDTADALQNSDYTFGMIHHYESNRFGLVQNPVQNVFHHSNVGTSHQFNIWFNANDLWVGHDNIGGSYNLGPASGHIVITYDKTLEELTLFEDGVQKNQLSSVAIIPDAGTTPTEWISGANTAGPGTVNFRPMSAGFQHLFHVDKLLTPAQVAALFASVPE